MYAEDPSLSAHKGYDVVMTEFKDATSPGLDIKNTSYVGHLVFCCADVLGYLQW